MKILIVASYFPPHNSIASLRPYAWAKYWQRCGHEVTVLTTKKIVASNSLDLDCNSFRVFEVLSPLDFALRRGLGRMRSTERDWVESSSKKRALVRFRKKIISALQYALMRQGILNSVRMPSPMDLWLIPSLWSVRHESWDVVIGTYSPYVNLLIALAILRLGKSKKFFVDFRDLWVESHTHYGLPVFRYLESWLERKIVSSATGVVTVSEGLAEILRGRYRSADISVIANGYDFEDDNRLQLSNPFPEDGKRRIVFTGSLYPLMQNPRPFFEALESVKKVFNDLEDCLEVVFAGANNADIVRLSEEYSVMDVVRALPLQPRSVALNMQRFADALLFFDNATDRNGVLTGKIFEYLVAERPVMGVGLRRQSSVGHLLLGAEGVIYLGENIQAIKDSIVSVVGGNLPSAHGNYLFAKSYSREKTSLAFLRLISDGQYL